MTETGTSEPTAPPERDPLGVDHVRALLELCPAGGHGRGVLIWQIHGREPAWIIGALTPNASGQLAGYQRFREHGRLIGFGSFVLATVRRFTIGAPPERGRVQGQDVL